MENLSIRCTTCRTRLKVRDHRILGQILPCPKCGGMVLIDTSEETAKGQTPTARDGSVAGRTARRSPLRSESFDHIDRLLDEPLRLPAAEMGDDRWKVPDSSKPEESEVRTTGPSDTVESVETAEPAGMDWIQSRRSVPFAFVLMGGGVVAGVAMAVGVTGWIFSRSDPPNDTVSQMASELPPQRESTLQPASESATGEIKVWDDASEEIVAKSPPDVDDNVSTDSLASTGELDTNDASLRSPDEGVNTEVVTAATELDAGTSEDPPQESPGASPSNSLSSQASAENRPTVASQHDDLAAFAQWLQDPVAELNSPEPPDPPETTEPVQSATEVAIGDDDRVVLQPTRTPPRLIDVNARLTDPISGIQLRDVSLASSLRFLTQMSTIPIHLAPEALGRRNLRASRPVSLTVQTKSVADVLGEVTRQVGLAWLPIDGHVLIMTPDDVRGDYVTIRHDVSDLTDGSAKTAAVLADWITRLIEPGTWLETDDDENESDRAVCEVDQGTLVVVHHDTVQFRVLEFCEKLRTARGISPRTRILKDRIRLGARTAHCTALNQSVSIRSIHDGNIDQVASLLEEQTGVTIVVDWPSLHEAGWSPADVERVFFDQLELRDALNQWLRPKGLSYRVFDSATIEIASVQTLAMKHDVEFYPLRGTHGEAADVRWVSQKLLSQFGKAVFQPQGAGALAYDEVSQTLIVSLPQSDQIKVDEIVKASRTSASASTE